MARALPAPAAERRSAAVRALIELAASMAPDAISTAAIAERMGLSHGALFRHFSSRDDLWAETVRWATEALWQRFDAVDSGAPEHPMERVEAILLVHVGFVQEHPGLLRMLFAELQRPETSAARETGRAFMARYRQRLARLLQNAQERRILDSQLDVPALAGQVLAVYQGLMLQGLINGSLADLPARTRQALAVLFRGLGPQPAGPAAAPGGWRPGTPHPPPGTRRRRPTTPPADSPAD
ncbi:MAG: TetR family transcriptional regulator [Cyanobium sp.]|nr:MAG: TetR family transcriptional regulator [Cyanobium sp.]